MANPFNQLKDLISALEDDFEKSYEKHNAAAGTRVRKGMQELKNMAQQIRLDVQNQKNSSKDDAAAPAAKKAAPAAAKKAAPAAAKKAAPAAKKK
jgi:membrane protease subunit (stomatin/prohibitin family)